MWQIKREDHLYSARLVDPYPAWKKWHQTTGLSSYKNWKNVILDYHIDTYIAGVNRPPQISTKPSNYNCLHDLCTKGKRISRNIYGIAFQQAAHLSRKIGFISLIVKWTCIFLATNRSQCGQNATNNDICLGSRLSLLRFSLNVEFKSALSSSLYALVSNESQIFFK